MYTCWQARRTVTQGVRLKGLQPNLAPVSVQKVSTNGPACVHTVQGIKRSKLSVLTYLKIMLLFDLLSHCVDAVSYKECHLTWCHTPKTAQGYSFEKTSHRTLAHSVLQHLSHLPSILPIHSYPTCSTQYKYHMHL